MRYRLFVQACDSLYPANIYLVIIKELKRNLIETFPLLTLGKKKFFSGTIPSCNLYNNSYSTDDGGSEHFWDAGKYYQTTRRNIPKDSHLQPTYLKFNRCLHLQLFNCTTYNV